MRSLLYIAVLPVIVLLFYIYKKDEHKEPGNILAKVFFFGVLAVIPTVIVELVLDHFFPTNNVGDVVKLFINVLIGIALIEEGFKWLVVKVLVYKKEHFDETFDAIVYSVFSSLGFACIENILYVLTTGYTTGLVRAITAVPLHACDGVIMGYFIGKAKLHAKDENSSSERLSLVLSIIIPTITHAIYDFMLFAGKIEFIIAWLAFVVFMYVLSFILIKKSKKSNESVIKVVPTDITINENSDNHIENAVEGTYCRHCGYKINNSNFCPHCGKKKE